MYKRVLICLDLEGVNNVAGVPYEGLAAGSEAWEVARHQAALEVNAAAEALFDSGVEYVALWDNHGAGNNVDPAEFDPRIDFIKLKHGEYRDYYFRNDYDGAVFMGYHAMEGTLGGILAHTFNSKAIQYYKINGRYVGEFDMDSYLAAGVGVKTLFFAGDDITCSQAKAAIPHVTTVATKKALSRNEAIYRDNGELIAEIKEKVKESLTLPHEIKELTYPTTIEVSYKRTEDAVRGIEFRRERGIECGYLPDEIMGYDAHTVVVTVNSFDEFARGVV